MTVAPAPERTRKGWDIALTIVLLVLALAVGLIGAIFALVSLAFIDYCPTGCSIEGGVSAQFTAVIAVALVGVVGLVASIVRLVTRRRAWWVALTSLLLIVVIFIAGWIGYTIAVGG